MAMIAELMDTDMSTWAPGTRHYRIGSEHIAVESDDQGVPPGVAAEAIRELLAALGTDLQSTRQLLRPTTIFSCNSEGIATDLTPLHEFPAGTTHEAALAALGYTIQS